MKKYRLRRGRQQAMFGLSAGIQAAAALTSAGIQAAAARDAARQQADAMQSAAQQQADAINTINENNNALQLKNAELIQAENAKIRDAQEAMQMSLQMMAGRENEANRLAGARIKVKNGGKPTLLRGSYPSPMFTVTDGGNVIPIGNINGQQIYEVIGNDHEHYHKTRGGKYKSGVGIKFADGEVIEAEGNQNGNQGELMIVDGSGAKFLSKHSIRGFNPSKAVMSGMNPEEAFIYQEILKDMYNIEDDGKNDSSPVGRVRTLKCGGRHKANLGTWWKSLGDSGRGNMIGSGISLGGNLLGGLITSLGNTSARNALVDAYTNSGNTLINAYKNLKTIDPNIIRRSDYQAPHAMAAISSANVDTSAQLSGLERAKHENASSIARNTASGAARLNRLGALNTAVNQSKNEVYHQAALRADEIRKENANRLTQVSVENANRDAQANAAYNSARLALAQYNNQIENERITGAAQARADMLTSIGGVKAGTRSTNALGWANAINNGVGSVANTLANNAKMLSDFNMTMLGATPENKVQYYLANPYAPGRDEFIEYLKSYPDNPQFTKWVNSLNGTNNGQ